MKLVIARINDDSDNEESDEEIDYPEEDDEELLFEEDVPTSYQSRNQKVALGKQKFKIAPGPSMILFSDGHLRRLFTWNNAIHGRISTSIWRTNTYLVYWNNGRCCQRSLWSS